jgi:hypothetical protein
MPAKALILWLLLLSPFATFARFAISGKVLYSGDQKPIPGATVFLSNASSVTTTDKNGAFTISDVSNGQYVLVVSLVGYNTFYQTVAINNNLALSNILVTAKGRSNNVDTQDSVWMENYEAFKAEFLGRGEYARDCKIINPEVIKLRYDKRSALLIGSSTDFIIIENKALGYRIKYLLSDFRKDFVQKRLYFSGAAYFENLPGNSSLQAEWKTNRLNVYLGSSMHFLRSLLVNQLSANGFAVRPAIVQASSTYKDETLLGKKYSATLVNSLLNPSEFMKPTTDSTLHALIFDDALYVTYSNVPVKDTTFNRLAPATVVFLNKRYAAFDNNGILTDPSAVTFDGVWGQSHLSEMLPVDYEPTKK